MIGASGKLWTQLNNFCSGQQNNAPLIQAQQHSTMMQRRILQDHRPLVLRAAAVVESQHLNVLLGGLSRQAVPPMPTNRVANLGAVIHRFYFTVIGLLLVYFWSLASMFFLCYISTT